MRALGLSVLVLMAFSVPAAAVVFEAPRVLAERPVYFIQRLTCDGNGNLFAVGWGGVHWLDYDLSTLTTLTPQCGGFSAAGTGTGSVFVLESCRSGYGVLEYRVDGTYVRSLCPESEGQGGPCDAILLAYDTWRHFLYVVEMSVDDEIGIRKYDAEGNLLARWRHLDETAGLSLPKSIAVGPNGHLYISDYGIIELDTSGRLVRKWTDANGRRVAAVQLAITEDGRLYTAYESLDIFDAAGTHLSSWSKCNLGGSVAVDEYGHVYTYDGTRILKHALEPGPPLPAPHPVAVLLHISSDSIRATCRSGPGTLAEVVTKAPSGASQYVYLLATPDTERWGICAGLTGIQLGITYNTGSGDGIAVHSWTRCTTLDFPMPDWPAPGTGNTMTWALSQCQKGMQVAPLGYFEISVYSASVMSLIGYPVTGLIKAADCTGGEFVPEFTVDPAQWGWVSCWGGSRGQDNDGCNPGLEPCVSATPVRKTTWGRLKTLH